VSYPEIFDQLCVLDEQLQITLTKEFSSYLNGGDDLITMQMGGIDSQLSVLPHAEVPTEGWKKAFAVLCGAWKYCESQITRQGDGGKLERQIAMQAVEERLPISQVVFLHPAAMSGGQQIFLDSLTTTVTKGRPAIENQVVASAITKKSIDKRKPSPAREEDARKRKLAEEETRRMAEEERRRKLAEEESMGRDPSIKKPKPSGCKGRVGQQIRGRGGRGKDTRGYEGKPLGITDK
jgi:hypothetical protein